MSAIPTATVSLGQPGNASKAWMGVAVLFMAQVFAFMDRQVLSLLIGPMKADLLLSDTEVGLIIGFAFAAFYVLAGFPVGYLVDRRIRPPLLALGMTVWSLCTVGCGYATSFWQLGLLRSGVGIGEAVVTPVVVSLLADYFPSARRGLAYGLYAVSVYVGGGLAMIVGSLVVRSLDGMPVTLPMFGELQPWRVVFLLVGLPGLALIPLLLRIHEPRRSMHQWSGDAKPSVRANLLRIRTQYAAHWRAYASHHAANTFFAMCLYGVTAWTPEFLRRTYGVSIAQAGLSLGAVGLVAGSLGVVCGGVLSDALLRRGHQDARLRATKLAAIAAFPFAVAFPLASNEILSLAGLSGLIFFGSMISSVGSTGLQELAPAWMRGTASAVYLFVFNGVGLTLGPLVFALSTDKLFGDPSALWKSLAFGAPAMVAAAGIIAALGSRAYVQCVRAADRGDAPEPITTP